MPETTFLRRENLRAASRLADARRGSPFRGWRRRSAESSGRTSVQASGKIAAVSYIRVRYTASLFCYITVTSDSYEGVGGPGRSIIESDDSVYFRFYMSDGNLKTFYEG